MNTAKPLPIPATFDRVEAARNVIQRADGLAHIAPQDRHAILTLAWEILHQDRARRRAAVVIPITVTPARPVRVTHSPSPARAPAQVISLLAARIQRRAANAADAPPKRPRITVAPANPKDPKDAA